MVGKRHASDEIAAKLAHANELVAKGKTQREISKALGVSIMTYHRWKKTLNSPSDSFDPAERGRFDKRNSTSMPANMEDAIRELERENAQLRRLVTDMLLEKLRLEDEIRSRQEQRFRQLDTGQ